MINRVVLVGRLTKDVELRYTTSGAAAGSFTLAVNRQFTNSNGERETDFINGVIWRKSAENFANFTSKGSLVAVEGRLQTRNYENQ
ncbi:single-stranded DNA-binding protein, partial [Weissella confusa]